MKPYVALCVVVLNGCMREISERRAPDRQEMITVIEHEFDSESSLDTPPEQFIPISVHTEIGPGRVVSQSSDLNVFNKEVKVQNVLDKECTQEGAVVVVNSEEYVLHNDEVNSRWIATSKSRQGHTLVLRPVSPGIKIQGKLQSTFPSVVPVLRGRFTVGKCDSETAFTDDFDLELLQKHFDKTSEQTRYLTAARVLELLMHLHREAGLVVGSLRSGLVWKFNNVDSLRIGNFDLSKNSGDFVNLWNELWQFEDLFGSHGEPSAFARALYDLEQNQDHLSFDYEYWIKAFRDFAHQLHDN